MLGTKHAIRIERKCNGGQDLVVIDAATWDQIVVPSVEIFMALLDRVLTCSVDEEGERS